MSQLELKIERPKEVDRNFHLGGRSFYFFDFDDNVAFLTTPIVLFHKQTNQELRITSGQWAQEHFNVGKTGIFADYELDFDDRVGSFKFFRDHDNVALKRLGYQKQTFIQDVAAALGLEDFQWKGPSWSCFFHATFNQRPVSVITARGHHPETIKNGIKHLVHLEHLPIEPNYLSIFPVSHIDTRKNLGDSELNLSIAQLKQRAIRASVKQAIEKYGFSPHHRFGMSDDDPKNIQLIFEEMTRLKTELPEMSFFMIETQNGEFVKNEITLSGTTASRIDPSSATIEQFKLF